MLKIRQTLTVLLLLIALNSLVFTQTSSSTTVPNDKTVAFLIEQNKAGRDLISVQEKRISDLEAEIALERENSASISKSYEAAKMEISSLKQSNEALARAVSINESTIAILKDDNAKQREKAKKANRDKWKAIVAAAAVIALKIAIP